MSNFRLYFGLPICLAVGIFLFGSPAVYAENPSLSTGRQIDWYTAGVGVSSLGSARGISFSYPSGNGFVSLRYVNNQSEFNPSSLSFTKPSFNKSVWDAGVLYGKVAKTSYGMASVSGGIGAVGGVLNREYLKYGSLYSTSNYRDERFLTFGFPVEGQLFWTPSPIIGIGIYGFVNLNPEASFAGALLGVQLGNLK